MTKPFDFQTVDPAIIAELQAAERGQARMARGLLWWKLGRAVRRWMPW